MRHVNIMNCVFVYCAVCVAATLIQSGCTGIFCRTHSCEIAKALCMVTKARSVGDNEGNGEGLLSSLYRNVSPCPGHNAQFSLGPQQKNMPF